MIRVRDILIRGMYRQCDTKRIRYTHACGVRFVFLEHGGGPLDIVDVVSLHLRSMVLDICLLHIFWLCFGSFPS